MKRIGIVFFALLLTLAQHSFAEESKKSTVIEETSLLPNLAVEKICNDGLEIVLNNGSLWDIKYFGGIWAWFGWGLIGQEEVSHWTAGDVVEIQYPDTGNLMSFFMVIKNLSKNEEALVELKAPPSVDKPACLWVVNHDETKKCVELNDGTVWSKTTENMLGPCIGFAAPSKNKWLAGDAVTLIRTAGYLCQGKDCSLLLWNHSKNEMPFVNKIQ